MSSYRRDGFSSIYLAQICLWLEGYHAADCEASLSAALNTSTLTRVTYDFKREDMNYEIEFDGDDPFEINLLGPDGFINCRRDSGLSSLRRTRP